MCGSPSDGVAGVLDLVPGVAGGGVAGEPARGSGGGVGVSVFGEDVEFDERVTPSCSGFIACPRQVRSPMPPVAKVRVVLGCTQDHG